MRQIKKWLIVYIATDHRTSLRYNNHITER